MEEWRLYSEPVPGDQAPHAVFKWDSRHPLEEAHFQHSWAFSFFEKRKTLKKKQRQTERVVYNSTKAVQKQQLHIFWDIIYVINILFLNIRIIHGIMTSELCPRCSFEIKMIKDYKRYI